MCLSFLKKNILKGFDDGFLTGMILNDLKKHFIQLTMTYILLKKLSIIGFSDDTI